MADLLYIVQKPCPLCEQNFNTARVRNKLRLIRQDTDFCSYFEGINPYYYNVWVCPHCGYAAQDTFFEEKLSSAATVKMRNFLNGRAVNIDFGGVRTREQAIATYKLAIYYADITMLQSSRAAGLWMRLGWLYREAGQAAEEIAALTNALAKYEQAANKERFPIGAMTAATVQFLIGELYRRTGRTEEASIYLGRLATDPQLRSEKKIFELARECWQLTRSELKAKETQQS